MQRRALRHNVQHAGESGDAARGQGLDRTGADGVDADVLLAQIPRQITHGRFERRLAQAHHVIVWNDLVPAEIRQRQHRSPTGIAEIRQRGAGQADEGVRADLLRQLVAFGTGVHDAAFEVFLLGKGHGVDQHVQLAAENLADAAKRGVDLLLVRGVHGETGQGRVLLLCQRPHARLDALALIGQRHPGAFPDQRLGDPPGDGVLVGDANDESGFPLAEHGVRGPWMGSVLRTSRTAWWRDWRGQGWNAGGPCRDGRGNVGQASSLPSPTFSLDRHHRSVAGGEHERRRDIRKLGVGDGPRRPRAQERGAVLGRAQVLLRLAPLVARGRSVSQPRAVVLARSRAISDARPDPSSESRFSCELIHGG